jgi:hypothetical protein
MKLLHIGLTAKSESVPFYFRKYFDVYDEMQPHEAIHDNGKNYDICFMQIQNETTAGKPTVQVLKWVERLKNNGCKVINWTGDMRNTTPDWMIDFSKYVTITAFSNQRDVDYCKSKGINSEFLQIGIDDRIFTPKGQTIGVPKVIFLANNYGNQFPLGQFRREIVQACKGAFGNDFGVYGNGWQQGNGSFNHSQHEEAKAYRGAKVAISCSHYNSPRYTSDRLFRMLGCGVASVVHNYEGIYPDFDWGLRTFDTIPQMIDNIRHLLNDDNDRINYGYFCHEQSKKYTYDEMVKQIIEL